MTLDNASAFAVSDACFAECQVVAKFLGANVGVAVSAAASKIPNGTNLQGMLLRVIAWMRSLGKLDEPGDFQAVVSGTRALFELAVDANLLEGDRTKYPVEKLKAWESSAKAQYASTLKKYLDDTDSLPNGEQQSVLAFLAREKSQIRRQRAKYWKNKKDKPYHPMRWTGMSLADDAEAADKLDSLGFLDFYKNRYSQLCWNVHGSGLAGVGNIPAETFPFISGRAFHDCAKFALISAEKIARYLGAWTNEMEGAFKAVRQELVLTMHNIVTAHGKA